MFIDGIYCSLEAKVSPSSIEPFNDLIQDVDNSVHNNYIDQKLNQQSDSENVIGQYFSGVSYDAIVRWPKVNKPWRFKH